MILYVSFSYTSLLGGREEKEKRGKKRREDRKGKEFDLRSYLISIYYLLLLLSSLSRYLLQARRIPSFFSSFFL